MKLICPSGCASPLYAVDTTHYLKAFTDGKGVRALTVKYNADGRVGQLTDGAGLQQEDYAYDVAHRTSSSSTTNPRIARGASRTFDSSGAWKSVMRPHLRQTRC